MAVGSRALSGRYELTRELARGGMATVWCAQDRILAREVAVKILHDDIARDESFLERFRREAIAAARLAHPNIVAIYDTGAEEDDDGRTDHYIVMEFCAHGPLDISHEADTPAGRVAATGAAVTAALEHAHLHGVIHRDVKPANILIAEDGTIKVADFGIAKAVEVSGDITTAGDVLGTVAYISPEQASGGQVDERSDLYSLGVVLYELATGRLPFRGENHVATALKHIQEVPVRPRAVRSSIPRELEDVIMTALAKDPANRFPSAGDMRRALERASGGARSGTAPSSKRVTAQPSSRISLGSESRWIVQVLAVVAVTVLLALGIGALVDEDGPNLPGGGNGTEQARSLEVTGADDFDPQGDGAEHPELLQFAFDDDATTEWKTSTYFDPLPLQKDGVGVVFDLGRSMAVTRIELSSSTPGFTFEVRATDHPGTLDSFESAAQETAESDTTVELDGPTSARYWLIWITELPGSGTGEASLAEVSFFGS